MSPQRHRVTEPKEIRVQDSSFRLSCSVSLCASYNLTYSNSNGLPLMPLVGGAIQFAILPTSVTGFIRLRTYSRSSLVGNHSDSFAANSSGEIKLPSVS